MMTDQTDTAPCGCPRDGGRPGEPGSSTIRHDRDICTDPVVARLGWYADHADADQLPTYWTATRGLVGAGMLAARERYEALESRYHSARAEATLRAEGRWDPARYGSGGAEPLTVAEHLERLALAEWLSRAYQPHYELDAALKAGATVDQVAAALNCTPDQARQRIRDYADGQFRLRRDNPGSYALGIDAHEHAAILARAGITPGSAEAAR